MKTAFEFDSKQVFIKKLEVEDLGNAAILCRTDDGKEYAILSKTFLGKTILLKYGPYLPDIDMLNFNLELSFKKFDYKEDLIIREIEKYLQDPRKGITEAEVVSEDVVLSQMPTQATILNSL